MTYLVSFTGRQINATGITYPVDVIVEASDPQGVVEVVYKHYEHLGQLLISPIGEGVEDIPKLPILT